MRAPVSCPAPDFGRCWCTGGLIEAAIALWGTIVLVFALVYSVASLVTIGLLVAPAVGSLK
jgi:hypothetical protein